MTELRRSVSDPTELASTRLSPLAVVRRCASLISSLNDRVDIARARIRFQTISMSGPTKPGIGCKRCHGSVGKTGQHQGSRTGYSRCTLPHDPTCPGGVLEVPGKIAPCPDTYVLGLEFPGTAVEHHSSAHDVEDEDYDSATSRTSVSSQKSDDLEYETDQNAEQKTDQQGFGAGLFQSLVMSESLLSTSIVTPSVTTLPTVSHSTRAGDATKVTSTPTDTTANNSNGGGTIDAGVLMGFIERQMTELKLQVRNEVSQALSENERKQQQKQVAIQQQLQAVQSQVHKVQPALSERRVQFGSGVGDIVKDADKLRNRMQNDPKKKTLADGLISMQDIRRSEGLATQVEERMQSVYANPTLSAAPSVASPSSSQPAIVGASLGQSSEMPLFGASGGVFTSDTAVDMSWVQQQQRALQEYQENWQAQQQQLLNAQLKSYQSSLEEQNRRFQEQLKQQFPLSKTSGRVARSVAEAAAEKQRAARHSLLQQEEKCAELEVSKLKKSLEHAKRKQKELHRKVNLETSGAEDDGNILNRTLTSNNSTLNEQHDQEVEFLTDPESGMMYERPVFVQDPHTGIYRIKGSGGNHSSSQKESQDSGDGGVPKLRKPVQSTQVQQLPGVNQPLSGSVASNQGMAQYPVPLPQQLRQASAAAAKQGKQSEQGVPKVLNVSDWAKMCPTKSASSVTLKNMNLPMYLWGRLGELRAANAGICGTLPAEELEARLRHIQTVLQICMQNSTPSDFSNYGWELARCYDQQIQSTMDSGLATWVGFDREFPRTAHPAFLMEADREVQKPFKKKENKKAEDVGEAPGQGKVKKICPVFNSCKQRKKCQNEVDNPESGRCKMKHECSHCKKEHNKSVFHQVWWCNNGGKDTQDNNEGN